MPKTHVINWREHNDDGSAREGASARPKEGGGDGVSGPAADPPRKSGGSRSGKKSAAKRVSERRDSVEGST